LPRSLFADFVAQESPFDFALVQTTMTYWYLGVQEVIQDIRRISPQTKIILGGNYVTLCSSHAESLGADLLVPGTNLEPLWKYLEIEPDLAQPAFWEAYDKLSVGVLKLSDGCPFSCTYCSVPHLYGKFKPRPLQRSLAELELLANCGVQNIAFYDDALLFEPEKVLVPFLNELIRKCIEVNLHSPNALNARFITQDLARLMVRAGFKTFYLGFESCSLEWQKRTGSKVSSQELQRAVELLLAAGAKASNITAYQMLAHPYGDTAELEASMRFVHSLGIRGMLADFSPVPGTPDGEYCRKWVDMDEPLMHNKTAFPIILLGFEESNRLKDLQRKLNRQLPV
jgi:tRNA A37 methylthiotransferase MiaB